MSSATSTQPIRRRLEAPQNQQQQQQDLVANLLETFSSDIFSTLRWNYLERDGALYQFQSSSSEGSDVNESHDSNGDEVLHLEEVSSSPDTSCSQIASDRLRELRLAQSDIANLSALPSPPLALRLPSLSSASPSAAGRTLIVYTTCNQLQVTLRTLPALHVPAELADLVVVDDHSADGTPQALQRRGYAVVAKPRAEGLTDSWNVGYRLAVALGYAHVLFINNDVLVPPHALRLLHWSLAQHALVTPMTTERGAGHNPAQSLSRLLELPAALRSYADDPRNARALQSLLLAKFNLNLQARPNETCAAQPSQHQGRPKFNGFCFGVNLRRIAPAAFARDALLFDPAQRIVGQEDSLVARMASQSLAPMVLPCAFLFHFKAATVSVPAQLRGDQAGGGDDVLVERVGAGPMARLRYRDAASNQTVSRLVDLREDLRRYHPEGPGGDQGTSAASSPYASPLCAGDLSMPVLPPRAPAHGKAALVPPRWLGEAEGEAGDYCVFPSHWAPPCAEQAGGAAQSPAPKIVVAIATSDPAKTPSAGDLFTAAELGRALAQQFGNVQVRYLRRGAQWYSAALLRDVDVLVA
eukprot:gene34176-41370_t